MLELDLNHVGEKGPGGKHPKKVSEEMKINNTICHFWRGKG